METSANDTDHKLRLPSLRVAPAQSDVEDGQLKDELLTVLLHDLRSPLGAITVLTDLISTVSNQGEPADARQLQLLREAVGRAQRVLEDALEIQSVLRGSLSLNSTVVDVNLLLRSTAKKASSAPYFRNGQIDIPTLQEQYFVRIDQDKAETVLLGIIEQIVSHSADHPHLDFNCTANASQIILHISNLNSAPQEELPWHPANGKRTMRGRLGTRRIGESHFTLQICQKILKQMGGGLEINTDGHASMEVYLPRANR